MTYQNFTIIEDIFDDDMSGKPTPDFHSNPRMNYKEEVDHDLINLKKINGFRTLDSHSARPPYPVSNISEIPSLSYDENMIKNKLHKQINPRLPFSDVQLNSMNSFNNIMRPPQFQGINSNIPPVPTQNLQQIQQQNLQQLQQLQQQLPHLYGHDSRLNMHHCRNIYEHIEECPVCNKYYKQSNRFYIFIIIILVLFILFLLRRD